MPSKASQLTTAVLSQLAIKPLVERGILPPNVRRIILDFEVDKPVRVLYECFADKPVIDAVLNIDLGVIEVSETK